MDPSLVSFKDTEEYDKAKTCFIRFVFEWFRKFLSENNSSGINLKMSADDISTYIKIFVLFYADDTVIFGTDEVNFQNNLNAFFKYSQIWKLDINFDKTKILVFGTRNDDRFNFKLGENTTLYVRGVIEQFVSFYDTEKSMDFKSILWCSYWNKIY